MSDRDIKPESMVLETESDRFSFGKTIYGELNERGQFVPYPDDYVPPPPGPATHRVSVVDVGRGTITIEALDVLGGQPVPDCTFTEPRIESFGNFISIERWRWPKRERRKIRMARKKRRGWA